MGLAVIWQHWRRWPGLWLVPLVVFAATAGTAAVSDLPVLCVWRLATGVPCAGCGLTRGFVALGHGHLLPAFHYNLLAPGLFAAMIAWWFVAVSALLADRAVPPLPARPLRAALVVVVAYWLLRAALFLLRPDALEAMREVSPVVRLVARLLGAA